MLFRSNDTATTEIYTVEHTLSLHDALPSSPTAAGRGQSSGEPAQRWELIPGAAARQARSFLLVKCIAGERRFIFTSPLSSQCKMSTPLSLMLETDFVMHSTNGDEK